MRKRTIENIYRINSMSRVKGLSVTTDSDGNTYVLGQFFRNMFAGNIYQESTESAVFIAQLSSGSGTWKWSTIIHEYSGDNNFTVSGEIIYHQGFLYSAIIIDNRGLVVKTNRSGIVQYSKSFTGTNLESLIRISLDKADNLYLVNTFSGTLTFHPHTLSSVSMSGYVTKVSPTGEFLWVRSVETGGSLSSTETTENNIGGSTLNDIVTSLDGTSYVIGRFTGTIILGNMIVEGRLNNPMDFLLAEIDTKGFWTRLKAFPNGQGTGIDRDKEGNLYIVGGFMNQFKLGGSKIKSEGINLFVAKLDTELLVDWVVSTKYDTDIARNVVNIVVDNNNNSDSNNNNSYINGFFNQPISFGHNVLTPPSANSNNNVCEQEGFKTSEFVAKLSEEGNWLGSYQIDGIDSTANSKNLAVNDSVWVTGGFGEKLEVKRETEYTPKTSLFLIQSTL